VADTRTDGQTDRQTDILTVSLQTIDAPDLEQIRQISTVERALVDIVWLETAV